MGNTRTRLLWWLSRKGVLMLAGIRNIEITNNSLTIITSKGEKQTIMVDTVIPSLPLRPNEELIKSLEGKVPEVYAIGDCARQGLILEAIGDASRVAYGI